MTRRPGKAWRLGRGDHRHAGPVLLAGGMRVIVRKERPHPGAQLRFSDIDGTGSPALPPARTAASSLTWNCATAAGPGVRTASAARKTPGCATCPSRDSRRTRSGARSSRWPASCWPGCRRSPWIAPPADGNPNAYGCACSPPPGASSAGAGACGCASRPPGPGPPRSPLRSPDCRPLRPADQRQPAPPARKAITRARGTRPPGATAGPPGTPGR
jgi:hypothetical protein